MATSRTTKAAWWDARSARLTLGPVALLCLFVFLEVLPYRLPSGARITYPVFLAVSLAILIIFRRHLLRSAHRDSTWPVGIFAAYVVWMAVSTFWSYHPFTSISESLPVAAALLLAVCFSGWSLVATIKSLVVVGAVVALCSWVMFLIAPSSAVIPDVVWRLSGPLMHSQRLGLLMGMSLISLVSLILNNETSTMRLPRYVLGSAGLLLAGTLVATNTRAFTAFVFVTLVLLFFLRMGLQARVLLLVIAVLLTALILLSRQELFGLVSRGDRDSSLTGRIPLWSFTVDMIGRRPLQGWGFATFGTDLTRPATGTWIAPHAHNAWLNAAFETGLVGAALMTLFLAACLVVAFRTRRREGERFSYLLGPVVFTILCGATGLLLGGRLTTPAAILLLLAAQAAREGRRARAAGPMPWSAAPEPPPTEIRGQE
jgi:exopolysaccharide production protein ExoQ